MQSLTVGLDKILNGIDVDKPLLQVLSHKKLPASSRKNRYSLLVSDGKRMTPYTILTSRFNPLITNKKLTKFSICQINNYTIIRVNNDGKQIGVIAISGIEVKVPGDQVGHKIGNPRDVEHKSNSIPAPSVQRIPRLKIDTLMRKHTAHQSSNNDGSITPIVALSPVQNRWVIKARAVSKSGVKRWANSGSAGKLFSMDLVDQSGEIRCTAFRNLCTKFYDMIEVGQVYLISGGKLKIANKQYNHLKNVYEMTLIEDSNITPCRDFGHDIPTLRFDFVPIADVEKKEINYLIDVLGAVKSTDDLQILTSRTTGKEMKKRDVNLVDESNTMVCLTLWDSQAEEFDGSNNPVLAVKGSRVAEFNGEKKLSAINSTVLQLNPNIPEAHRLRSWFNTAGRNEEAKSISGGSGRAGGASGPWLTFKETKDMELGVKGPAIYTIKATVSQIRIENILYKSCPSKNCKKKVIDEANDMYRCEKCNKQYPNFRYRLLASLRLADWTGDQWVTVFNDEAEKILGITAQELGELQENDNDAFLEKLSAATFKSFIIKTRVKEDVFGGEGKLSTTCLDVSPVDYKVYNDHLITQIKELVGKD